MDAERWRAVQRIFHDALALEAEERGPLLDRACGDDEDMRAEVESLLAAHLGDPDFLETPVMDRDGLEPPEDLVEEGPALPDQFEIVRRLGQGGMGEVYLATQTTEAFTRPVAIKVVKRGMDTEEVLRRFRLERRILAELAHPHIAQLHDAGATADGRPFFVMEFVEGERIDRYAERRGLSIAERLRLFQAVCAAIQHAHQKLIVHRDVKPGNVLVRADGAPKLVDFGIGKVLSDTDDGDGSLTRTRALRLTPDYASPEQLRGEPVTTGSDVYALGVLLYELLTGRRPWADAGGTAEERARRRSETSPSRPSEAVGDGGPAGARTARLLRGDLDNIVLTAMHPELARRYPSALALSDDISRYLEGRPVRARADSFGYRASKFVRRNRWGVATAAALVLGLLGVTGTTAIQSSRVARERDKAREVQSFLLETFGASTAEGTAGDSVTVRQLLDGQVDVVRSAYESDPELRAEMLTVLADAYERLGLFGEAEGLAREGLEERIALFPGAHADVAFSTNLLGWIRHQRGASEEGAELLEASVDMWRALGAEEREGLARALNDLGSIYDQLGRSEEAEALLSEALAIRRRTAGPLDRAVAITSNNLAVLMYRRGDYAAADSFGQAALDALRASLGPDHQRTFVAQSNLATFRWVAGDLDGAAEVYEDLLDRQSQTEGGRNARTASSMVSYASLLRARGDMAEAEALLREALAIQDEVLGPHHRDIGNTARILAVVIERRGRADEALPLFDRAVESNRVSYGTEHPQYAEALFSRGTARERAGDAAAARSDLEEAVAVLSTTQGEDHPRTLAARTWLGAVAFRSGDIEASIGIFERTRRLAAERDPPDRPVVLDTQVWLAEAHEALGDHAQAEALLRVAERDGGEEMRPGTRERMERLRERLDEPVRSDGSAPAATTSPHPP